MPGTTPATARPRTSTGWPASSGPWRSRTPTSARRRGSPRVRPAHRRAPRPAGGRGRCGGGGPACWRGPGMSVDDRYGEVVPWPVPRRPLPQRHRLAGRGVPSRGRYVTPTGGTLVDLSSASTCRSWPTARRPPPRARPARDRSCPSSSPVPTAFARVACHRPQGVHRPADLVRVDGRWQIIAKVFHFDVEEAVPYVNVRITDEGGAGAEGGGHRRRHRRAGRRPRQGPATTHVVVDEVPRPTGVWPVAHREHPPGSGSSRR